MQITEGETRFELENQQNVTGISTKGVTEDCSIQGFKSFYGASRSVSRVNAWEYAATYSIGRSSHNVVVYCRSRTVR